MKNGRVAKRIVTGRDAQELLSLGALITAKAVSPTLGPSGRTVLMDRRWKGPGPVSDGFTINRELELPDPVMDMAVRMLEVACEHVRQTCGDGTTSTVILSEAILRAAQPCVAMGADPMALARGIKRAERAALRAIRALARPLEDQSQLNAVAGLACKDAELGSMVAELVDQTGADGSVLALESNGRSLETLLVEGFQFDKGLLSEQFITDRLSMEATLEDPYLLLTGEVLEQVEDLLPALERILPDARRLAVIARDVKGEALAGLAMNHQRGNLEVIAVQAPGIGGRQEERLEDLAAATGATVLPDPERGRRLAGITLDDLGQAARIVADRFRTTIHGGHGDTERMARRIASIRDQLADAQTDQYKRQLLERIGSIQGRNGYIYVGAPTEAEAKELLQRIRNGVAAAQDALRSGILPGAGAAYVRAALEIEAPSLAEGEQLGFDLLLRALSAPLRQLAYNAGDEEAVILNALLESPKDHTYDAPGHRIGPAAELGILESAGTAEMVLRCACSVASTLLTVDVAVAEPRTGDVMSERLDMGAKYE